MKRNEEYLSEYSRICFEEDDIDISLFDEYGVKRGLRDKNGNGVLSGLTNISRIEAFQMVNGVKTPCDGKLWYRGYDCIEL
ncbi:MAG: citrate synthase, partial [Lachnospiraceae bacterium]|nr:citrate synthase [Lachnospiraceae bacterium]